MPLLKCKECGNEISITAVSCPNCGDKKPFDGQTLSPEDSKGMSIKERKAFQKAGGKLKLGKKEKISFAFFGLLIILGVAKCSAPLSPEDQAKVDRKALEDSARHTCQYYIEKSLNDPASVEYGRELLDRIVIEENPGKWMVQLNLSAKNKFNAMVKAQFMCKLERNNEKFHLLSIKQVK